MRIAAVWAPAALYLGSCSPTRLSSKGSQLAVTVGRSWVRFWNRIKKQWLFSIRNFPEKSCSFSKFQNYFPQRGRLGRVRLRARPCDPLPEGGVPTDRAHQPHLPTSGPKWLRQRQVFCFWLWQKWVWDISDYPPRYRGRKQNPNSLSPEC